MKLLLHILPVFIACGKMVCIQKNNSKKKRDLMMAFVGRRKHAKQIE